MKKTEKICQEGKPDGLPLLYQQGGSKSMIISETGIKRLEKLEEIIKEWTEEWAEACAQCRSGQNHSPETLQAAYFDIKYGKGKALNEFYHKEEIDVLEALGFDFTYTYTGKITGKNYMVKLQKEDYVNV